MEQSKSRKRKKWEIFGWWSLLYTLLFLAAGAVIWHPFYKEQRSLIWGYDGLYQTYTAMVYYSQYWREFFQNLFSGKWSLPMVDASVGLGFDVFTSLNHYGFGDPLEVLAIFFSGENMEICYNILAILRYYLAGLSFGGYCFYMKQDRRKMTCSWHCATLVGAIAYCFCGFALYTGVRHPYFMNSMIYFPVLCIGAEQVLRKQKGWILSVMVGIAACSNFYFLYMLTILIFLYAVVRFVSLYGETWKREFWGRLGAGIGWYLLGIGMGSLFLLPNILAFWNNARGEVVSGFSNTWYAYPSEFYKELWTGYFFPEYTASYWCVLGYSPVFFLGFLHVFQKKREDRWLGWWCLILTLILWIPLGGYVMNGLSYVSHRWLYGYSFCVALLVARGVEKIHEISPKRIGLYAFFLGMACIFYQAEKDRVTETAVIVIVSLCLLAVSVAVRKRRGRQIWIPLCQAGMLGCVVYGSIMSSTWLYAEEGMHYTDEFQLSGTAWESMTKPMEAKMKEEMEKGGFYRVEGDTISEANYGMLNGIYGTNPFFSIVSKDVYEYMKSLENPDSNFPNWYNGMGDRPSMMSLASVRYFATEADSSMQIPFGYEKKIENGDGILYETSYAMPLGYTYQKILSREEWNDLSALQKQQAMMQAAVLDEIGESEEKLLTKRDMLLFEEQEIAYTLTESDNIIWNRENGTLQVGEGGGTLLLEWEGIENAEIYLRVCNFDTDGSGKELIYFFAGPKEKEGKKIYVTSDLSVWDGKFKNYLVAVGNGMDTCQSAKLSIPFSGTFHLDDIKIYALPTETFGRQAQELKKENMNTTLQGNQIKGEITVSSDRFLCVSMPYSSGWKAKVDGKRVPVRKCNGMYMGIFLNEGHHVVDMVYRTPGLITGAMITVASLLIFLWSVLYVNKKRSKMEKYNIQKNKTDPNNRSRGRKKKIKQNTLRECGLLSVKRTREASDTRKADTKKRGRSRLKGK